MLERAGAPNPFKSFANSSFTGRSYAVRQNSGTDRENDFYAAERLGEQVSKQRCSRQKNKPVIMKTNSALPWARSA